MRERECGRFAAHYSFERTVAVQTWQFSGATRLLTLSVVSGARFDYEVRAVWPVVEPVERFAILFAGTATASFTGAWFFVASSIDYGWRLPTLQPSPVGSQSYTLRLSITPADSWQAFIDYAKDTDW